ncbi:hypothetical protein ACFQ1L_08630 [Phytohabitans flavus]|uniref:hypothetical protein n=1 Tax=Phytohabitans flavus TaxID=1076124 RepID=UPI00362C58F7
MITTIAAMTPTARPAPTEAAKRSSTRRRRSRWPTARLAAAPATRPAEITVGSAMAADVIASVPSPEVISACDDHIIAASQASAMTARTVAPNAGGPSGAGVSVDAAGAASVTLDFSVIVSPSPGQLISVRGTPEPPAPAAPAQRRRHGRHDM